MVEQKKLRIMIITMGGDRQQMLQELLSLHDDVDITFVPGVPSRALRNRASFLKYCHQAGILPAHEWDVLKDVLDDPQFHYVDLSTLLQDVPVVPGRSGSPEHQAMHYAKEIWCKGKALNRGRAVLACTLAHLIHLRQFTNEGFDVLFEDNVRLDHEWRERIRDLQRVKEAFQQENNGTPIQMMYYGWLGSVPNLGWMYESHARRKSFQEALMPFPVANEIENTLANSDTSESSSDAEMKKPGGNPVWGSYGYWMSKAAYTSLLESIQKDVGSLLWKGKRQRHYQVKPVDKILPRKLQALWGPQAVQLPLRPVCFRAPMLTSKIHTQWDPEFCKSTTLQLEKNGMEWSRVGLTETEKKVVAQWKETGEWKAVVEPS